MNLIGNPKVANTPKRGTQASHKPDGLNMVIRNTLSATMCNCDKPLFFSMQFLAQRELLSQRMYSTIRPFRK
jgi:hypothetical protein